MNEAAAPVIIVGAGPVGLSLSLGLAHYGIPSIVLEKKTELNEYSRALLIATRTLEIFRAWGVYDRFLQETSLLTKTDIWLVGRRAAAARMDFGSLARWSGIPGVLILPQNRTEAVLLEQVEATGLVDVRFGVEVNDFRDEGEGVTVSVNGPQGTQELQGSFLAGCDGAHSVVREKLGWHLQGKTYPSRLMLVDVKLPGERGNLPWPRLAPQPNAILVGIRFASGEWRIIATLPKDESDEAALSDESIKQKVEALFGPGPFECRWSSGFRIHCRNSPHFSKGRVALAGDSAHINSPAGGQGMNSGIHDAHNLAWKLRAALDGGDIEALLGSYEQERRGAVTRNVERITDLLTRLVLTPPSLVRGIFGSVMRLLIRLPMVRARIALTAGMLVTKYSQSDLLGEGEYVGRRAFDGNLRAGACEQRLLDLVNDQAALLLFDDGSLPGWEPAEMRRLLAGVPRLRIAILRSKAALRAATTDEGLAFEIDETLWHDWDADGGLVALVRPDGYIGWTARRPAAADLKIGVMKALGMSVRS